MPEGGDGVQYQLDTLTAYDICRMGYCYSSPYKQPAFMLLLTYSRPPQFYCINFAICGNGIVFAIAIISVSVQSSTAKVISELPNGTCNS
jgi:hypothetical protein